MSFSWQLEYDSDGDLYTEPDINVNEARVEGNLNLFDGRSTFYCSLFDKDDETCIWCYGEPEQRIIEVLLFEMGQEFHFVLARREEEHRNRLTIHYGSNPEEYFEVSHNEVFSRQESIEVLMRFFRTKDVAASYLRLAKSYLY